MSMSTQATVVTTSSAAEADTKSSVASASAKSKDMTFANPVDQIIHKISLEVRAKNFEAANALLREIPKADLRKKVIEKIVYLPYHRAVHKDFNYVCYYKFLRLQQLIGKREADSAVESWHSISRFKHEPKWSSPQQINMDSNDPIFFVNWESKLEIIRERDDKGNYAPFIKVKSKTKDKEIEYKLPCSNESKFFEFYIDEAANKIFFIEGKLVNNKLTTIRYELVDPEKNKGSCVKKHSEIKNESFEKVEHDFTEKESDQYINFVKRNVEIYRNNDSNVSLFRVRGFLVSPEMVSSQDFRCSTDTLFPEEYDADSITEKDTYWSFGYGYIFDFSASESSKKLKFDFNDSGSRCSISLVAKDAISPIKFSRIDWHSAASVFITTIREKPAGNPVTDEFNSILGGYELYESLNTPKRHFLEISQIGEEPWRTLFISENGYWERSSIHQTHVDPSQMLKATFQSQFTDEVNKCFVHLRRPFTVVAGLKNVDRKALSAFVKANPEYLKFEYGIQLNDNEDYIPIKPIPFIHSDLEKEKYGLTQQYHTNHQTVTIASTRSSNVKTMTNTRYRFHLRQPDFMDIFIIRAVREVFYQMPTCPKELLNLISDYVSSLAKHESSLVGSTDEVD